MASIAACHACIVELVYAVLQFLPKPWDNVTTPICILGNDDPWFGKCVTACLKQEVMSLLPVAAVQKVKWGMPCSAHRHKQPSCLAGYSCSDMEAWRHWHRGTSCRSMVRLLCLCVCVCVCVCACACVCVVGAHTFYTANTQSLKHYGQFTLCARH